MILMLVRHKVADFNSWKQAFDSHADAQRQAGLRVDRVLRNFDNPNEVFLLFEVLDVEKARAFVSSPMLPQVMKMAGVVDKPDITFLS